MNQTPTIELSTDESLDLKPSSIKGFEGVSWKDEETQTQKNRGNVWQRDWLFHGE